MKLDAVALKHLGKQAVGAAIQIIGGDNLIARVEQLYYWINSTQTRGEANAMLSIF